MSADIDIDFADREQILNLVQIKMKKNLTNHCSSKHLEFILM